MAESIVGMTALQHRLAAVGNPSLTQNLMRRLATASMGEAKLLVPKKTGNLARSIHVGTVTPTTGQVVASANYAAYVEHGTGPHEITPNARKALRWAQKGAGLRLSGNPTKATQRAGAFVFAKKVHHPGTHEHPYLLPGAKAAVTKAGLAEQVITAWNEAA